MEVVNSARGGFEFLRQLLRTVPLQTGAHDFSQFLRQLVDAAQESLDRVSCLVPCGLFHLRGDRIINFLEEPVHRVAATANGTKMIVKFVTRDPTEPGTEIPPGLKRVELLQGRDKHFLRQVIGKESLAAVAG